MASDLTRRRALGALAAAAALAPGRTRAAKTSAGRVVIVGGGAGGATAARHLSLYEPKLAVTLVEREPVHTTGSFANGVLARLYEWDRLRHDYRTLANYYRVDVRIDAAVGLDPVARRLDLAGGARLDYDRLVVAPGVDLRFDAIEGYDQNAVETMPHAWTGGEQILTLKRRLQRITELGNGLFVIVAPPAPYRCPMGPYERASMVALSFRRENHPKAKLLLLDAKDGFAGQDLFEAAWAKHAPGRIEWVPARAGGRVVRVEPGATAVVTEDGERIEAEIVNVIPPQTAGAFAHQAGLTDASGWCPIDPATMASTLVPDVHVVGDAAIAGDMPKTAFAANSQAKTCAAAIRHALTGAFLPTPAYFETRYALLNLGDAVFTGGFYAPKDGRIRATERFASATGEPGAVRRKTYAEALAWYGGFVRDVFG